MVLGGEDKIEKEHSGERQDDTGEQNLYGQRANEGRTVLEVRIFVKATGTSAMLSFIKDCYLQRTSDRTQP